VLSTPTFAGSAVVSAVDQDRRRVLERRGQRGRLVKVDAAHGNIVPLWCSTDFDLNTADWTGSSFAEDVNNLPASNS
jgi:hypothetical protein